MIYYSIELVSAFLFFAVLILVYNLRTVIESYHKESFSYITTGLTIIALSSIAAVLEQQNVFINIPFLNEAMFFQLLYWIGMITGMTLLLSGVSNWLPVYRKHLKFNSQELIKLEIFKKIEQLIRFESRNNIILLQALELINKHYNFTESSCFLFSQKEKKMNLLGAVVSDSNSDTRSNFIHFHNTAIADSIENKSIKLIYITESHYSAPDLILPMEVNGKLLGALCFYNDQIFDAQCITNLKLVIDILTQKLHQTSKDLQHKALTNQAAWNNKIDSSVDTAKTLKENINPLKKLLQSEFPVDYLSVSFAHQGKNPKLTVSENNQVLENLSNSCNNKNELECYVLNMNLPVVIDNLDIETDFIVDLVALQNDMKSIAACPITNSRGQIGVIVVGSKKYKAFSKLSLQYIKLMNSKLERLIENSLQKMQENREFSRRNSLKVLRNSAMSIAQSSVIYKNVADFLVKELKASFVRVSLFDQDKRFLNSQVVSTVHEFSFITPYDATMMLSLMPNHQEVLQQRKTVTVLEPTSTNDELSMEQRQIFGDVLSQYIITPVYHDSLIVGVITIGHTSDEIKIGERDICLVEDAASILTIHMYMNKQKISIRKMQKQLHNKRLSDIKEQQQKQNIKSSERISNILQNEFIGN